MLVAFKYLGRSTYRYRGRKIFQPFKYLGPIIACVIAIVWTFFGNLYLSPGCTAYDAVAGTSNIYVASIVNKTSVWKTCTKTTTAVNFLGVIQSYYPPCDNPGCVPMVRNHLRSDR